MVIVGTKCEESARVEILFSCCCRWFFPITSPAVHELVRKVTMAEHTATMRYLMNAFIFGFIRFSCPPARPRTAVLGCIIEGRTAITTPPKPL